MPSKHNSSNSAAGRAHRFAGPASALFPLPITLPRSTQYTELGVPAEATAAQVRAAVARHDARLQARGASTEEIAAAHSASVSSDEARVAHDARHPPLALMSLQPTWEPFLDDREIGVTVLRREIENFLAAAGEPVRLPEDTGRTDFAGDFQYCHLLDGPTAE